jgi:prevent-host-death family protein
MKTVGSYEAKTHLPRLLDQVAQGERITITKHGVPVAQLVPVGDPRQADIASTVEKIKQFRKGKRLDGLTIRELIDEGRRF